MEVKSPLDASHVLDVWPATHDRHVNFDFIGHAEHAGHTLDVGFRCAPLAVAMNEPS
jgi:hypothetical protein